MIDHCISAIRRKTRERNERLLYEAYTANALKTIAEISAAQIGGSVEIASYMDLWEDAFGKKKDKPKETSEQIISRVKHTLDVLGKL